MAIAYSFAKEGRKSSGSGGRKDSPGPDAYDPLAGMRVVKESSPEWTISRTNRPEIRGGGPGPGDYEGDITKMRMNVSYTMGASRSNLHTPQKVVNNNAQMPGPGFYEPAQQNKVPSYTMGSKRKDQQYINVPGPGSYDVQNSTNENTKRSNVQGFGSNQKRDSSLINQTSAGAGFLSPGPGQYEPNDSVVKYKNPTFGINKGQGRQGITSKDLSPGPGSYQNNTKEMGKGLNNITFKSRPQTAVQSDIPGPGSYNNQHKTITETSKSQRGMSSLKNKSERMLSVSKDQIMSPGPGAYDAKINAIKDNAKNIGFSKTSRSGMVNKEEKLKPGPGNYNADKMTASKSFKIGQKINQSFKNQNPGPGNYDPNPHVVKDSIKNVKISNSYSKSLLNPSKSQYIPGPGQYNQNSKEFGKDSKSFQIRGKPKDSQRNDSPGPGAYDPTDALSKDRIKSASIIGGSTQRAQEFVNKNQVPGPGQYDSSQDFGKSSKSFTFKGKPQEKDNYQYPGPGQYEAKDNLVKPVTPGYKQSQSTRKDMVSKEEISKPGPGQYQSQHKQFGKDAVTYSMGARREQQIELSPGPGQYDAAENLTKSTIRNFKMSTSKRADVAPKTARDLPGPGAYQSNKKFGQDKPAFSMNSKRSEIKRDKTPGPGSYDATNLVTKDKVVSYRMGTSNRTEIVSKDVNQLPGPGIYEQKSTIGQGGPQYSFQPKKEPRVNDLSPGPGVYEPNNDYVKDKVITYQMGSSQRTKMVSKEFIERPGPGNYDSPVKKTGPQYTMGGRSKSRQELLPGPGQYDPKDYLSRDKTPSYGISQSQRQELVQKSVKELPGPGAYANDHQQFGKDAKSFLIRGKPEDKIQSDVPGPGTYQASNEQIKDRVISHKISQSQRGQIVTKEMLYQPGPGEYDSPKAFGADARSAFIKGKPNDISRNDSPGPGQYSPDHGIVKDKIVSYKMGSTKRNDLVSKEQLSLPGPGIYDQESTIGKNKTFTIGQKAKDQQDSKIPGPGSYDPKDYLIKDQALTTFKISQSQRQQLVSREFIEKPGPGQYDSPQKQKGPNYTMGGRSQSPIQNEVPGPGQYQPDNNFSKYKSPSYKMNQKSQRSTLVSKEELQKPGPGNYSQNKGFGEDAKSFQIKGRPQEKVGNEVPGPGNYEPQQRLNKDSVITYKIGSSQRVDIVNKERISQPGPGQYESPSRNTGKSFKIGERNDSPQRNDKPGPGQYDPNESIVKHQNPSVRLDNKTQRTNIVNKEELQKPGPGNYSSSKAFGEDAKSFQIRGRPQEKVGNEVPGPGNYEAQQTLNKDSVITYKIGSSQRVDIVNKERISSPGPGQYDSPSKQGGPNYTIGERNQSPQRNDVPGPGQYDLNESIVKHQNPSVKLDNKTQRTNLVSKEEQQKPGPGNYTFNKGFGEDAKSFQIRGKPQEKVGNEVPGPGNYEPVLSQNKDRVVSYKIGSSQRTEIVQKESTYSPGPGQYDSPSRQGGPNYTIGAREEISYANDKPGPGQYDLNESLTKYQSPSYKMDDQTKRTALVSQEQIARPGPGIYDQASTIGKGPSFQIRGKPNPEPIQNHPGPGTYEGNANIVKDSTSQSFRISQNKRETMVVSKEYQQQPGPGQYDVKLHNNQAVYTFQGKAQISYDNQKPGPGAYEANPNLLRHQNPSIDFSHSPDRSKSPQRENLPGPGEYDSRDYNVAGHSVIVYSIPKGEKKDPPSDTPGPGYYKLPAKFADVPRYNPTAQNEEFRWV